MKEDIISQKWYAPKRIRSMNDMLLQKTSPYFFYTAPYPLLLTNEGKGVVYPFGLHAYFFSDRYYNVFHLFTKEEIFHSAYVNIASPITLVNQKKTFIDYDVDIIVLPDFSYTIVDQDEFEENQKLYGNIHNATVNKAKEDVILAIKNRTFPFCWDANIKFSSPLEISN
jgi:protein associated with RNAse G/E